MHDRPSEMAGTDPRCQLTRLAESSVAVVDRCACGVIQVHLGALTLRFAPGAAFELLATLGDAMTRHAAHAAGSPSASAVFRGRGGGARRERGRRGAGRKTPHAASRSGP